MCWARPPLDLPMVMSKLTPFFNAVITFSSDYDKIQDIIHCGTVLSKMASKSKAVPTKAARRRTTLQQVLGKKSYK